MNKLFFALCLVCSVVCCNGSSLDSRIKANQAYFDSLSPQKQKHLREFVPVAGDTVRDLLIALGEPDDKVTRHGKLEYLYINYEGKVLGPDGRDLRDDLGPKQSITLRLIIENEIVVKVAGSVSSKNRIPKGA